MRIGLCGSVNAECPASRAVLALVLTQDIEVDGFEDGAMIILDPALDTHQVGAAPLTVLTHVFDCQQLQNISQKWCHL